MQQMTGWGRIVLAGVFASGLVCAQTLTNQALNGKYFFRHVSLGTDAAANITDARSLMGTITFDGNGRYTFAGQQVQGNTAATSQTGSGAYSVDPAGFVAMDSPLRAGAKVNARIGPEALLGSSTESTGSTYDLLVAIPAPSSAPALSGSYWTATLEFPGGAAANARNTIFNLTTGAPGKLADFTVNGHAANVTGGLPISQQVTAASDTLAADGTGTLSFGASSATALISGTKTVYISADGNVLLGGSTAPGSHDILIGVKAASNATNATWNGNFWGAGLRLNLANHEATAYAGAFAARGAGKLTWTKRFKTLGFSSFDFTGINNYVIKSDGSGTAELTQVGLSAGNKAVVGSAIAPSDPDSYEIYFGAAMTPLTGTGVFLNPQGVTSAASFRPAGTPISPGEFVALFGTGLAKSAQTATPPYPNSLNGVSVTINGKPAPLYSVSPTQINCLVPYSVQGPTATVIVQNSATSNSVTVPVAATSPGIFSLDSSGSGPGAILHADYSLVNAAKPATGGETVLLYLTGMGPTDPSVADGTAGGANPLSRTTVAPLYVLVAGEQATVLYSGLAPGYPGLYQMNVTLPAYLPSGALPVAIQTPNAFHDQVDITIK